MIIIKSRNVIKTKKKIYLNLTKQQKKIIGFKYDRELSEYIYRFSVYKAKDSGKTTLYCKMGINDETNEAWFDVFSTTGQLYAPYYNRKGIKSDVIKVVDKNIKKELSKINKLCRGDEE